ncbi:MAG: ABC transporter permease [Roseburia sp.]|jgi:putative ABC transport system permease protein|nr:ABC transporter permease [Roseburia sp.]
MKRRDKKTAEKMIALMAKESLRQSRMRNLFIMITIILASALLTAILMFAAGQKQKTKAELSHRQQVSYYNLTDQQLKLLEEDERIACQIRVKQGILSGMDGFDVMPFYVNELSDQIRTGELESGRMPEGKQEIAVPAALSDKMGIRLQVGSEVTFTFYDGNTETFTVTGILKSSDAAKQFSVYVSEDYAREGSQLKDAAYEVHAKLCGAETMSADECREVMYQIGADAGIERKNVNPSRSFLDTLSVDMQSVSVYGLTGLVILLAAVFVIYGVFYLSVIGRIHQFGQLRTVGMTKKQMKRFVSREGRMLFFRSAPAGVLIGIIGGGVLIPDGFDLKNTILVAAAVFVTVYAVTMLSVRRPARIASLVSPMEALRYVPQDGMKQAVNKKLCRSLTPFGLGVMNFSKNKKKAVITMCSLGLGGILFMTAATYMSSYDKEKFARQGYFAEAEFRIHYPVSAIELSEYGLSGLQADVPLGDELIQELLSWDGVKQVTGIKCLGIQFDVPNRDEYGTDDSISLMTGEESRNLGAYLEAGSADCDKLMSGDYVLVVDNDLVKEVYGWGFEPGDTLLFHYYDGSKMTEKEMVILGILNRQYTLDHMTGEGWFLMPEQAALRLVSYPSLNGNLLVSTEAEKEEAVGEKLAELISEKPELALETLKERRIVYKQDADQLFGAISGLAIFIMMFSILSMMNTMITNIVTRKQEIAMLESIGMGKRQIRTMLLGESLLLAFLTIGVTMTVGTLCGYALSSMLYDIGAFYMEFRFPTGFAFAYTGVLVLTPLLITIVCMYGFSREALIERLRGAEG